MNYAKIIGSAIMLFPKKITVILVDAVTNNIIGKYKLMADILPSGFDKPTIIELDNTKWRVLKANPVLADEFQYRKKLTLHVQNAAFADPIQFRHSSPTICELPGICVNPMYGDRTVELNVADWRNLEFLPLTSLPEIESEIGAIRSILVNQQDALLGYQEQFSRSEKNSLDLPFGFFCQLVGASEPGNVFLAGHGYVENGFSIRTENYIYYGILRSGYIGSLCITRLESADDELMQVLTRYELVLCDWSNANVLSITSTEGMPEEPIQF